MLLFCCAYIHIYSIVDIRFVHCYVYICLMVSLFFVEVKWFFIAFFLKCGRGESYCYCVICVMECEPMRSPIWLLYLVQARVNRLYFAWFIVPTRVSNEGKSETLGYSCDILWQSWDESSWTNSPAKAKVWSLSTDCVPWCWALSENGFDMYMFPF